MPIPAQVFLSHTTKDPRDSQLAHKLAGGLASQGVKPWIAPEFLPAGDLWEESIVDALVRKCSHFLVILSESSIRSPWVLQEIGLIRRRAEQDRDVKVIPLRIGDARNFENDDFLRQYQDLEYLPDFASQLRAFIRALGLPPILPALFRKLISDTTQNFVGREKVFASFQQFLANEEKGTFLLLGEPGIGKTTILAEYVRRTGCPAHFNISTAGIDSTESFFESISGQLETDYGLAIPPQAGETPSVAIRLADVLERAAETRPAGEPLVLAIDALDEVNLATAGSSANILQLPPVLPTGVFLLLSGRPREYRFLSRDPQTIYDLNGYPAQNRKDIELCLRKRLNESAFQLWLDAKQWTLDRAVVELASRSENNFMYLHYVLHEIVRGNFRDTKEQLPVGLRGYYSDHWRRMGMTNRAVSELKLDVLQMLAIVRGPIGARLISDVLRARVSEVREVLDEWQEFLQPETLDGVPCYRLYHSSFQDFLLSKEAIQDQDPARWLTLMADHFSQESAK